MKQIKNSFSIKRVGQLLLMDLKLNRLQLLSLIAGSFALFLVPLLLRTLFSGDYLYYTGVVYFMSVPYVVLLSLFYFMYVSRRLHAMSSVSYSTIPATNGERYAHLLILGILMVIMGYIIIQCSLFVEALLNPSYFRANPGKLWFIWGNHWITNNSFSAIFSIIMNILFACSIALYSVIRFRNMAQSVTFIVALAVSLFIITRLISLLLDAFGWNSPDFYITHVDPYNAVFAISKSLFYLITIGNYVICYFRLKKLQQRS
ncbi:hypothetical protein [Porphyromonas miyakawae]|uniref:hypothetical protein n=1 Tax=Porphyromonas miyakawae TaxID=3137470 RepID=UPI00398C255D